jgi:hypothetical protein
MEARRAETASRVRFTTARLRAVMRGLYYAQKNGALAMGKSALCAACDDLIKTGGRFSEPHKALRLIETRPRRGSMFGGWEETTYQCETCSAVIEHTNDKNEFPPFWWEASGST